jgi:hypothetical protein
LRYEGRRLSFLPKFVSVFLSSAMTDAISSFVGLNGVSVGTSAGNIFFVEVSSGNGPEVTRSLRSRCPASRIIGISVQSKEKDFLDAGADAFC